MFVYILAVRFVVSTHHIWQKQKPTIKVGFYLWWEWVDSNHLSRKTTDLQSAPALQLRRTPKTFWLRPPQIVVRAAGIEPAFQAWKACILALELCSQRFSSPLIISYFLTNASVYSVTSTLSIYLRDTFSIFTDLYSSFDTVSFSSDA